MSTHADGTPFGLFERFGVEVEYMVVDRDTLAVRPIVDHVLRDAALLPGAVAQVEDDADPDWPGIVELGPLTATNELTAHVLEFKTTEPIDALARVPGVLAAGVRAFEPILARHGVMLMPTGMHPTMDPSREMVIWPHDSSPVYRKFDSIFDCRGHGWANLQAVHLNLPFAPPETDADDTPDSQFGRLHAAIRALLPLMPALSASSPISEGKLTGVMDNRLEVYRHNARRVPQVSGRVIPDPVYTRREYEGVLLESIYAALAPHDPEGLLRHEWANSRGCIARFSRNSIEVRVLDVQECPSADAAICAAVAGAVRAIAEGRLGDLDAIRRLGVEPMHRTLLATIDRAGRALVTDAEHLWALGWDGAPTPTAGELWAWLIERTLTHADDWARGPLRVILRRGCLAQRIIDSIGEATPGRIAGVYRDLARCLARDQVFDP